MLGVRLVRKTVNEFDIVHYVLEKFLRFDGAVWIRFKPNLKEDRVTSIPLTFGTSLAPVPTCQHDVRQG